MSQGERPRLLRRIGSFRGRMRLFFFAVVVVPTIAEAKGAESAALLLESLAARGGHFANLAANAVVIVSQHKYDVPSRELKEIAEGFEGLAREVVTIPYDPALGADLLSYEGLQPRAQRAWLRAAAAVARGL